MKNKMIFGTVISLIAFLGSCDIPPWGCIEGNGRIAIEERFVGDFEEIVSSGSFTVDVLLTDETALSIEADENLLPYIETYIQGNALILGIKNDRCIKSREAITIYIDAANLEKLKLSGSGVIYCDNIIGEDMDIVLSGSGTISCFNMDLTYLLASMPGSGEILIGGTAATSEYNLSGSGLIKGLNLLSDKCYASIPGSGNIYTTTNTLLDVNISGSGSVYYQGNPEIIKTITGSGNVREYN